MVFSTLGRGTGASSLRYALVLFAVLGIWAGAGVPAFAQEPERGMTVRERPRADYDPIGIRSGGFLVYPSLTVAIRHDDNIYRTEHEETPDSVLSVQPRLTVVSQWSNHGFVLDAGIERDAYHDNNDESSVDYFVTAAGRVDITRDTGVEVQAGVERLHEDRGDPNAARTPGPAKYIRSNVAAEASHDFNRLSLAAGGALTHLAHRVRSQADRDRLESTFTVQAGYRLVSEVEAFARATGNVRDYEHDRQGGFDRDSEGLEIVAGTELDLGGIVRAEVFAGYRRQDYDDRVLPRVEGPAFGGSLLWNVTPLTTVNAEVRRSVEESVLAASGFLATRVEAGVDHELLRNLVLSVDASVTRNDYESVRGSVGRDDDSLEFGIGGVWLVDRNVHVDFGYRFERRDSTAAGNDYDSRMLSVGLKLQL